MATVNLGRVQGGGFFGSTSSGNDYISKSTVLVADGVTPLVGDTIVNADGELCQIVEIVVGSYKVQKYGSIKEESEKKMIAYAFMADTAEYASGYTKGGAIDRALKEIIERLDALTAATGGN